jgi:citronellol/citronellal dehydrogenase
MSDRAKPDRLGLSDDELAAHPTVFASNALASQVVVVSGGGQHWGETWTTGLF